MRIICLLKFLVILNYDLLESFALKIMSSLFGFHTKFIIWLARTNPNPSPYLYCVKKGRKKKFQIHALITLD